MAVPLNIQLYKKSPHTLIWTIDLKIFMFIHHNEHLLKFRDINLWVRILFWVRILVKVMYEEGSAQVFVQEKEECRYICNSCIRFIWMIPMKDAKWSIKLCFLSVMLMLNPIRNLSQQLIKVLEGLRFLTEHWRVVLACFRIENYGFVSSKNMILYFF